MLQFEYWVLRCEREDMFLSKKFGAYNAEKREDCNQLSAFVRSIMRCTIQMEWMKQQMKKATLSKWSNPLLLLLIENVDEKL